MTTCPTSYFMDKEGEVNGVKQYICKECESPCLKCEQNAKDCTQCDGSLGRSLLWQNNCYKECPIKTAADIST